ncbi:MAG: hypothetical protein U0169_26955 [Polyangiaceae bacterium]
MSTPPSGMAWIPFIMRFGEGLFEPSLVAANRVIGHHLDRIRTWCFFERFQEDAVRCTRPSADTEDFGAKGSGVVEELADDSAHLLDLLGDGFSRGTYLRIAELCTAFQSVDGAR